MFTTKPELGEKITKLGGGVSDAKTPFTEFNWVGALAMRRRPSPSGRQPMLPRAPAQVRARWSRQLSART